MKSGPIIILDDDAEDHQLFEDVLRDLEVENEILWFKETKEAIHFLRNSPIQPFIIFSDVNLPGLNGIEFKRRIDEDRQLRKKSIPFVFYSTAVNQEVVNEAYTQMTVQGFFLKESRYTDIKRTIKAVVEYWTICRHPNAV